MPGWNYVCCTLLCRVCSDGKGYCISISCLYPQPPQEKCIFRGWSSHCLETIPSPLSTSFWGPLVGLHWWDLWEPSPSLIRWLWKSSSAALHSSAPEEALQFVSSVTDIGCMPKPSAHEHHWQLEFMNTILHWVVHNVCRKYEWERKTSTL